MSVCEVVWVYEFVCVYEWVGVRVCMCLRVRELLDTTTIGW